ELRQESVVQLGARLRLGPSGHLSLANSRYAGFAIALTKHKQADSSLLRRELQSAESMAARQVRAIEHNRPLLLQQLLCPVEEHVVNLPSLLGTVVPLA